MRYNQNVYYFFLVCLAASFAVVYFIIQPFLAALVMAAIFAFIFQPVYRKFMSLTRGRSGISAFGSTLTAIVLVMLPIAFVGTLILKEATDLYHNLANGDSSGLIGVAESILDQARATITIPESFKVDFGQYIRQGLEVLVRNLGVIFSSFAGMLINSVVFLIAFYFFLKDGEKLKDYLVKLSPLDDKDDELIVSKLRLAISATIKGSLTIGLIQGLLTGIGFAIFGVPNPVLWGSVAAVAALIPGVGTSLVLIPGILYLFLTGNAFGGFGLLAWGLLAVGLIDNLLGPKLIGSGMQLHPLAVFLAVLGGLAFFGPMGFILGPMAMSVAMALIDIYFSFKTRDK
jgi:predicted PurR-regulated permease PerM